MKRTYVVFTNSNHLILKRLLKTGFQHCYIIHFDGIQWIYIDRTMTGLHIHIVDDFNELDLLHANVIRAPVIDNKVTLNWSIDTCVQTVKNFIGLRDCIVHTPYQLYKRLRRL